MKSKARLLHAVAPSRDDRHWAEIEDDLEEFAKRPRSMGSLYAIVAMCLERPIKIGFAVDPFGRLRELQTANAFKLQILGTVRGSQRTEEKIHRYLADDRLIGEWFAPSARTMGVVNRFRDTAGSVALLSMRAPKGGN